MRRGPHHTALRLPHLANLLARHVGGDDDAVAGRVHSGAHEQQLIVVAQHKAACDGHLSGSGEGVVGKEERELARGAAGAVGTHILRRVGQSAHGRVAAPAEREGHRHPLGDLGIRNGKHVLATQKVNDAGLALAAEEGPGGQSEREKQKKHPDRDEKSDEKNRGSSPAQALLAIRTTALTHATTTPTFYQSKCQTTAENRLAEIPVSHRAERAPARPSC